MMSDTDVSHDIDDVAKAVSVAGGAAGAAVTFSGTSTAAVAAAVGDSAGGAILGAAEGAELISTVGAAGEITTIGAGAVLGTTAAAAGVALAGGLYVGNELEEHFHVGSEAGDFLYEHSNPDDAQAALHHYENAEQEWDESNYGSAILEGVESVGSMIEGVFD
jgi:hypothetical protein